MPSLTVRQIGWNLDHKLETHVNILMPASFMLESWDAAQLNMNCRNSGHWLLPSSSIRFRASSETTSQICQRAKRHFSNGPQWRKLSKLFEREDGSVRGKLGKQCCFHAWLDAPQVAVSLNLFEYENDNNMAFSLDCYESLTLAGADSIIQHIYCCFRSGS